MGDLGPRAVAPSQRRPIGPAEHTMFLSVLKAIAGPGSVGFFVLVGAVGLVLTYLLPRFRRLGRYSLIALFCGYFVLSVPLVAGTIADLLPGRSLSHASCPGPLDLLIVLDGDNAGERAREGGRVYASASPYQWQGWISP